jgi:hypothetical protein
MTSRYYFYTDWNCGYFYDFITNNPEFNNEEFANYCIKYNKADRDGGELKDIIKHEILRLAYEFEEYKIRFGDIKE